MASRIELCNEAACSCIVNVWRQGCWLKMLISTLSYFNYNLAVGHSVVPIALSFVPITFSAAFSIIFDVYGNDFEISLAAGKLNFILCCHQGLFSAFQLTRFCHKIKSNEIICQSDRWSVWVAPWEGERERERERSELTKQHLIYLSYSLTANELSKTFNLGCKN